MTVLEIMKKVYAWNTFKKKVEEKPPSAIPQFIGNTLPFTVVYHTSNTTTPMASSNWKWEGNSTGGTGSSWTITPQGTIGGVAGPIEAELQQAKQTLVDQWQELEAAKLQKVQQYAAQQRWYGTGIVPQLAAQKRIVWVPGWLEGENNTVRPVMIATGVEANQIHELDQIPKDFIPLPKGKTIECSDEIEV